MSNIIIAVLGADGPQLVRELSESLQLEFRERMSGYFGGCYFKAGSPGGEEVYWFQNKGLDGDVHYAETPSSSWILRIDKTSRDPEAIVAEFVARNVKVYLLKM